MIEPIDDHELKRYVVDPRDLTQAERDALERIHTRFLRRVHNGYGLRGERRVTPLGIVNRLILRGLVCLVHGGRGGSSLDTTSRGKETMRILFERRRKTNGVQ